MKKMNKKGFTIVELVIVIAVIAILAAVLIPTFSGVVDKANKSAALQEARAALTGVISMSKQGTVTEGTAFVSNGTTYYYSNNSLNEDNDGNVDKTPTAVVVNNDYYTLDSSDNSTVTKFKSDDYAKKVLSTLGYTTTDYAATTVKAIAYNGEDLTSKHATISQYAVKDGSETVYVLVADKDVYSSTTASGATILLKAGYAYVSSTAASEDMSSVDTGTTSFQLLYNSDFSKNVVVVIPNSAN